MRSKTSSSRAIVSSSITRCAPGQGQGEPAVEDVSGAVTRGTVWDLLLRQMGNGVLTAARGLTVIASRGKGILRTVGRHRGRGARHEHFLALAEE